MQYHFTTASGQKKSIELTNPQKVIIAERVEQVIPALDEIQQAYEQGCYCAGYVSYEAAPAFDPKLKVHAAPRMPLLWFGVFAPSDVKELEPLKTETSEPLSGTCWSHSVTEAEYDQAISRIKREIYEGNTYQVNYTMGLHADFHADERALFARLLEAQQASYSAFLDIGRYRILSLSPELFFHWDGEKIQTRPMKGTVRRGRWAEEDEAFARQLASSEKDRAENIMIVDLLRNDLSRVADPKTIHAPAVFSIERYPTVYQMTSTVEARTCSGTRLRDLFTALFPCGSITGAPKISTMSIIADLEQAPREVYCGSIGLIEPYGRAVTFNVAIRTLLIDSHTRSARYGVGGGITWDSTSKGEFDEILAKAAVLSEKPARFELFETMKLDAGGYFLLEEHLQRLTASARYFGISADMTQIETGLERIASAHPASLTRVKVRLSQDGAAAFEASPLQTLEPNGGTLPVRLASRPVNSRNKYLYHKTTNRAHLDSFSKDKQDAFDVLLWNEHGQLTEFTIGNVVVDIGGTLWTPPVEAGLLPGTFRAHLLKMGAIQERMLTVADLKACTQVWFINSVREWLPVQVIHLV